MLPGTTGSGQSKGVAFIGQAHGGRLFLLISGSTPVSDFIFAFLAYSFWARKRRDESTEE